MARSHSKTAAEKRTGEFLVLDRVSLRLGDRMVFRNTNWTWNAGEQWAILGPAGSGKSLLTSALLGLPRVITAGEVRGPFSGMGTKSQCNPAIGHVSPEVQRQLALQHSSFYQLRWHSGLEQGPRTVADFLSQESVEERNPFEVKTPLRNRREFLRRQRRFARWLAIRKLWNQALAHLSTGEMRRALLVHEMLKSPALLVLEDASAGLDAATRRKLNAVVVRLMRNGWHVSTVTHRAEDIPAATTHLFIVSKHRVVAQGPKREMLRLWQQSLAARVSSRTRALKGYPGHPLLRRSVRARPLVELRSVNVTALNRRLLRDISWTLREGERWALLGPNGAGKTTLLNLIQGDHPQAYSEDIRLFGRRTDSTQAVWRARQQIGWVSPELHQHYPPGWNAEEVVCSGFFNSMGLHEPCSRLRRRRARQWLEALRLGKNALTPFAELSFGQQRLLLLVRAMVKEPRLLILDEPCHGLDAAQRRTLLDAVNRGVQRSSVGLVFVTHHKDEIPRCITHTLQLAGGRIRRAGPN